MLLLMSDLITAFRAVAFHFLSLSSQGGCSAAENPQHPNEFISKVINAENITILSPRSLEII